MAYTKSLHFTQQFDTRNSEVDQLLLTKVKVVATSLRNALQLMLRCSVYFNPTHCSVNQSIKRSFI